VRHESPPLDDASRVWRDSDGLHIDVRGLEPPEPMVAILRLIDGTVVKGALIAHFDREPIFLYPELDDRGWSHEALPSGCGEPDCEHAVTLLLQRMAPGPAS
jgi:hypothetical protein